MAEDNPPIPEGFVPSSLRPVVQEAESIPEGFVPSSLRPVVQEEEEDDKGTFQDIGQGIGAGLVNIGQGLTELGAAGFDVTFDTDTSRDVTEFFEGTKNYLNLTPTGTAGKVAEGIVTFGSAAIPIVGWLGRANAVAKGLRVLPAASRFGRSAEAFGRSAAGRAALGSRVKLAASTSLATGAADVFLAPSTFNTVSDGFDALPDFLETEEDTGLTGADEGFRRLRNKLRFGVEGVAMGAAVEAAMPVVGAVARAPAYIPGVPKVAQLMTNGLDALAAKVTGGTLQKYFSSAGLLPRDLYEGVGDVRGFVDSSTREASKRFLAFEAAAKRTVRSSRLFGKGKAGIEKVYSDLQSFLTGGKAVDETGALVRMDQDLMGKLHGTDVAKAASDMRMQIDGMTDMFMKSIEDVPEAVLNTGAKQQLIKEFASKQGRYLRRMYEMHLNPEDWARGLGKDEKLFDEAVAEVSGMIQKQSGLVGQDLLDKATQTVKAALSKQVTEAGQNLEATLKTMTRGVGKGNLGPSGQPVPLFKIAQGMLKDRSPLLDGSPKLREFMGEIKDPKQLYLRTVGDMSQTLAANQFYRQYSKTSMESLESATAAISKNPDARPLAIDGRTVGPEEALVLKRNGYEQLGELPTPAELARMTSAEKALGSQFGAMTGAFVPVEVKEGLTIAARTQDPLQEMLAVSLQAKGLSQMTKTVLNPLSHVRNFHSGIFMIGANGNVQRGMNIFESARLTTGRLVDMENAEFAKTFNTLQKTGIVDQNYVVNEFRELLREGADLKVAGKISDGTSSLMSRIPFAQSLSKGAQNVYSGTDNFWKTVGFSGEKAKFTNAIRRGTEGTTATMDDVAEELSRAGIAARTTELSGDMDFMDLMAADIVKSTMPTYSRVPESIKMIRRIPFIGNFVAFPAEIMRTTTNITRQGLRELGFKVDPTSALAQKIGPKRVKELERQVRAIGAKRLSSYVGMAYMVPVAAQKAAMELTEFTQEQMEALERLSPYFSKGNTLAPIRNEMVNGKPQVDYVDLSYMMPYDFMASPARAALQAYSETGEVSGSRATQIARGMQAAVMKIAEPFASEALLAERIADVAVRDGETKTGASIFIEGENQIDRATKSVLHILGGFTPGAFEMFYRERRGELEPGRVSQAITGDIGRYGEERTAAEEAASLLTGFREMQTDLDKNFYYNGAEYTSSRNGLRGSFTAFARRNDVTPEDIVERYKLANQDLLTAQSRLLSDMRAAETLGLTESQIIRQLSEKANMGREEIGMLLAGNFRPITVSKDLVEAIMMETIDGQARTTTAENLPIDELVRLSQEYYQIRLDPKERPDASGAVSERDTVPSGFVPSSLRSGAQEQGAAIPSGFVPSSLRGPAPAAVTPATATATASGGAGSLLDRARTLAPGLLGDRRNQEIVDRANQPPQ
jgi:hypothetical protein